MTEQEKIKFIEKIKSLKQSFGLLFPVFEVEQKMPWQLRQMKRTRNDKPRNQR